MSLEVNHLLCTIAVSTSNLVADLVSVTANATEGERSAVQANDT